MRFGNKETAVTPLTLTFSTRIVMSIPTWLWRGRLEPTAVEGPVGRFALFFWNAFSMDSSLRIGSEFGEVYPLGNGTPTGDPRVSPDIKKPRFSETPPTMRWSKGT